MALIYLPRIPMRSHLRPRQRAGFGEERKRFRSSLHGTQLDATGSMADALLSDQEEEALELLVAIGTGMMIPTDPQLQRG